MTKHFAELYLILVGLVLSSAGGCLAWISRPQPDVTATASAIPLPSQTPPATATLRPLSFDGERAYQDVKTQVEFGPRVPGTEGHDKIQAWITEELTEEGWEVEIQESQALGHTVENMVAKRNADAPQVILGAHYDTRMFADNDPDPAQHTNFVPGANDGASGVAVLLELARSLPTNTVPVWLVFFDAEDNGRIEGWDWILGSREFVRNNPIQPRAAIIVDMVGDADLNIYKERNSDPVLTDEIWEVARSLGYESKFIPEYKYSMIDDHTPFIEAGIPAVDIIDFDYRYWHTVQDTPDKVSAPSLEAVGETVRTWVIQQRPYP